MVSVEHFRESISVLYPFPANGMEECLVFLLFTATRRIHAKWVSNKFSGNYTLNGQRPQSALTVRNESHSPTDNNHSLWKTYLDQTRWGYIIAPNFINSVVIRLRCAMNSFSLDHYLIRPAICWITKYFFLSIFRPFLFLAIQCTRTN